ncbi:YlxM family DNA-binding protein [Fusibacter sp. JL216-2]|uniref:YlxM family DNA-binding protein n=1 Tax=Fusibacter sp. JL216-2 TaxID=3071453 RepID=UPI003D350B9A
MIEKKMRLGNLFVFYGELLTAKQQDILDLYCHNDLSLGEISEDLEISRQAVYDTIRRSEKLLESYEDKLGLMERFHENEKRMKNLVAEIDKLKVIVLNDGNRDELLQEIEEIKSRAAAVTE